MTISIIVRLAFEGIHSWPECPFDDVGFLKNDHRHIFYIEAEKIVSHADRDVEIIKLKRSIEEYLKVNLGKNLGRRSCEDVAVLLLTAFNLDRCDVFEDNENGARAKK